jgi:hypothetical protein
LSAEKNDMNSSNRASRIATTERLATTELVTAAEFPLRCVWSSHPAHDRRCRSRIPARTVAAAWRRELELGRMYAGFFNFAWHGRVWLAYGMPDGGVRGVYCPTHRAEREERLGYDPELAVTAVPTAAALSHAG